MTTETAIRLRRIDLREPAGASELAAIARRGAVPDVSVREGARATIDDVRRRGADAVRDANDRVGGGLADRRLVLRGTELREACDRLSPEIRAALDDAIANVRRFAGSQRPWTTTTETVPGVEIERRWIPLASVGAYVPGGGAPYPSSLVMTVVPAQVAGVGTIVVATPAGRDGTVDQVLLGVAGLLDVDAVVVAGGAQAVAALALGLQEVGIEPVDRIVGPGNAWVTAAKLELAGEVGIDLPAGPSEGMVLADEHADPETVTADLITQAEHGPDSPALLVTDSDELAAKVDRLLPIRLGEAPRKGILARSLADHGRIILCANLDQAIDAVNAYAPEHLSVDTRDLESTVDRIHNAGSMFVGRWAPESAGDYATGANHVLPTGGLARASGALAVETYGKYIQVQRVTEAGLRRLRDTIGALATAEGLDAHRQAVEVRFATGADDAR